MRPNEKEVLLDTMKRLILTIHNNKIQQFKTFQSLSRTDFLKVLSNLDNKEPSIRRMSARLITELLYDNNTLKERFMEMLNVHPHSGNVQKGFIQVVFSKVPESLKGTPQRVLECMELLKKAEPRESKVLCWYIDTRREELSVEYVGLSGFSLSEFFDPLDVMFGIHYPPTPSQSKQKFSLLLKQSQYSNNPIRHKIKRTTPSTSEKPKFTFSSLEKGSLGFQNTDQLSNFKSIEMSLNSTKTPQTKSRFSNPISERYSHTATPAMTNSGYNKSKEYEGRGKMKSGIQITSPSSVMSHNKLKSQNSDDKIILLGGKNHNKQLSNSVTFTNPTSQPKPYLFNPTRSPNLTNFISTGSSSPGPKLQYTRLTSLKAKEQPQIKSFSSYKPSNDFIRKIKDSIRSREQNA